MRNKKQFWFDEKKRAQVVLLNGFPNHQIDYSKMYLVAKYMRHEMGYGEIRLERALIDFCISQDPNFNPVTEADAIKRWIRTAMQYRLRVIDSIVVTNKEIEYLQNIESPKDRKILFSTLIIAKALKKQSTKITKTPQKKYENYYIHYGNLADIAKLSKLSNLTEIGVASILHKYVENLTPYNPEKELIRIDFADTESEKGVTIDILQNIDEYYEWLFGKNKIVCEVCGKPIERRARNQKYCYDCSVEIEKEHKRERNRKWRDSKRGDS